MVLTAATTGAAALGLTTARLAGRRVACLPPGLPSLQPSCSFRSFKSHPTSTYGICKAVGAEWQDLAAAAAVAGTVASMAVAQRSLLEVWAAEHSQRLFPFIQCARRVPVSVV